MAIPLVHLMSFGAMTRDASVFLVPTPQSMTEPPAACHHLDCSEVLEHIYEFLDGELTERVEVEIRDHLAICRNCYPHFRHEEVFLQFLSRRAQIEKAPPALRRRILRMLVAEEVGRAAE